MKRFFNLRMLLLPCLTFVAFAFTAATPPAHLSAHGHEELPATLECSKPASLYCPTSQNAELPDTLVNFPTPAISGPVSPIAAKPATCVSKPVTHTVTYQIETRGNIGADLGQFKAHIAETYNDACGWKRLGVLFKEVASGGSYSLVLSEASQVPSFGSPCDSMYSCRVGRYVIINQDRWNNATDPWNQAGGDLRNYRHMVVNHETGHWLGHGHRNCGGQGQAAPVMQQQSINLQGCKFNPWPLDSEIWSSTLGI